MICTECGAENRDSAKFCNECGNALKPPQAGKPIPGPQPGMRYRRSPSRPSTPPPMAQQTPAAKPVPQQTASVSKTARPVTPSGSSMPDRTAIPANTATARPIPHRQPEASPAPGGAKETRQEAERLFNAEAIHRRQPPEIEPDLEISSPPRKKPRKSALSDNDNATIMIILALVFFAILAVGAGGVYFNLRDSHPELMRQEAEQREAARAKTEKSRNAPMQEMASFDLPFSKPRDRKSVV